MKHWIERFDDLAKREYLIASIAAQKILELVVRQEKTATGLGWLTEHAALKQCLHAKIRSKPTFHLQDCQHALILIGKGTGIAGLVAHFSQR